MEAPKGNILVVDDDPLNRIKLSTNLEAAGYRVRLAENGHIGLHLLRNEPFDTVLLDLIMPELDGFGMLLEVMHDEHLQHIPIIVISADDDIESVVRCIEMGAADHLSKPFNPIILRARISACVEKKRSRDREQQLFDELRNRYRQLQELEKLRDDLTHMIVHDLRTPLTSLLTGLMSIPPLGDMNAVQSECLEMATVGGQRLLGQINELLDISKLENGSLQLNYAEVDLGTVVRGAVAQVHELAADKGLDLQVEMSPGLAPVEADAEKMIRVLVNLCGNAIKFTPRGGTIRLSVRRGEENFSIAVADTGEGIPAEYLDRIFEKFGQVENRKAGRSMSTGLGLTFCKMVVERHGGKIDVESNPGRGSVFTIALPSAAAVHPLPYRA
jgi:signal transduction histidine kinase